MACKHTPMTKQTEKLTCPEDAQRELYDEQQDTTAGCESQNLGHEALVKRSSAFFAEDRHKAGGSKNSRSALRPIYERQRETYAG